MVDSKRDCIAKSTEDDGSTTEAVDALTQEKREPKRQHCAFLLFLYIWTAYWRLYLL